MTGEAWLVLLLIAALVGAFVHHQHDLREYPQIACPKCHGAGWRTKWIWHVRSMRRRKVRGECKSCHTSAWSDRRESKGWG